ncbi:MAG: hypothetical protein IPM39_17775 [Chloroflexi bacterium]|nr:hypothetical protein [Chloroflexota bacterium]
MDYGQVIADAWRITWNNKYLWVLGFLAALTSVGSSGNSSRYSFGEGDFANPDQAMRMGALALGLVCIFGIIGIILWLVSIAARAGLVDAVNRLDDGETLTLGKAFAAGRQAMWRLLGVYIITYLPLILVGFVVTIVAIVATGGAVAMSTIAQNPDELLTGGMAGGLGLLALCLCLFVCAPIPVGFVLSFVAEFGVRATVINKLRVTDSIRHGWQVFRANLGPVILLSILLFVIGIMVGLVLSMIMLPVALVFWPGCGEWHRQRWRFRPA